MFRNLLVSAALLLATSVSHAALHGNWIGFGEWTYQGSGTRCDVMTLSFNEGQDKLQRLKGYFDCGIVALDLPAQDFDRKGETLMVDGQQVGTVQGDLYQWTEQYNENVQVKNMIQVEGHHLTYTETWIEKDGSILYEIKGRLFLKE